MPIVLAAFFTDSHSLHQVFPLGLKFTRNQDYILRCLDSVMLERLFEPHQSSVKSTHKSHEPPQDTRGKRSYVYVNQ